jgi:predicted DNA-binding WGR domain protein
MSKGITVTPIAMLHEGGTKFYEVVTFANHDDGHFVEVRRWGKVEQLKTGGGQVSVDSHPTQSSMAGSADKQIRAKDKGGYRTERSVHGFHDKGGYDYTANKVSFGLNSHYSGNHRDAVRNALGIGGVAPADDAPAPKREEAPVDRGEQWGSW